LEFQRNEVHINVEFVTSCGNAKVSFVVEVGFGENNTLTKRSNQFEVYSKKPRRGPSQSTGKRSRSNADEDEESEFDLDELEDEFQPPHKRTKGNDDS